MLSELPFISASIPPYTDGAWRGWIRLDKGRLHVGAIHITKWMDGTFRLEKHRSICGQGMVDQRQDLDELTAQCVLYHFIGDAVATACARD